MRKLLLVLLIGTVARAQEPARVTIYTPGGYWRGASQPAAAVGGTSDAPSQGQIFDGEKKLALMFPGRFATFDLQPGTHSIATAPPEKGKRSDVELDVKPGEHYFLRLTTTRRGVWAIQAFTSHLEAVSCEVARKEADKTKPLQAKRVEKEARNQVVDATYFPRCPAESAPPK